MKNKPFIIFEMPGIFKNGMPVKKIISFILLNSILCFSSAQEIKMYTGINLVVKGNVYFVVNNIAFKNDGAFTSDSSTVVFTGNTDTSITYISGSSITRFNNLTLVKSAYGIAIQSPVEVKNVLTVSRGNLYTDSNLTLLSDITNTARLAAVPSSGAHIYGKAMVQRYIPARRSWRLLTVPVTDASTIYASWQNGGVYAAGKGMYVSGSIPSMANGLDASALNNPSLKMWSFATQAFTNVTKTNCVCYLTNNGSADNVGYFVFIRGDRTFSNFTVGNTNVTTLTSIGQLQTQAQVFNASAAGGGYTLIGNPYASPIDFNLVTRNNLLKRFYVWDPALNVTGAYVTIDDFNNTGVYSKSVGASPQTNEIQSSQAFFVETSADGAAALTINENAKSISDISSMFRPMEPVPAMVKAGSIRTNLYLLNTDNSKVLADGNLVEFGSDFYSGVSNQDALKFGNVNESLAAFRNGIALAIERRPVINLNDTIFLKLTKTTVRSYRIEIIPQGLFPQNVAAFFEDSYLKSRTAISILDTSYFNFTLDANAASAVATRFRIVFKSLTVLPLSFTSIKAYPVNNDVKVAWQVQEELNISMYEIEKSVNGVDFKFVNTTAKKSTGNYSWIDQAPFAGRNYYRIKSIDQSEVIVYSPIVAVVVAGHGTNFTIVPNPVKGKVINLQFANQTKGSYQFSLMNSSGQQVLSSMAQISNNSTSKVLNMPAVLPAGIYKLQIAGPANIKETQKLIIKE
ncbi:T9SS type A sorting domain-containing protein [Ferruginibacter sp.]|uniref:T9SS type A sorting domain-containing protein n=1 Tax=Ferruginibacter sp. TaxID=1940288 RepID=UPI00265A19BA|nr:T9SS type A sorting domain-containing protein [Ferruginibacter sp.]